MHADLPAVVAALQLPPFRGADGRRPSMAWCEDYLLANARIFVEGGIRAIKVQDETRETGPGAADTIARMAALGRAFRREYPDVHLGIIVQAHDAVAPLAIAAAADASFVRLKVFVGAVVNAEGERRALGVEAVDYRAAIGRPDIRLMADVHDRTSVPLVPVPDDKAALWAQSVGADLIVVTGADFADTLARVGSAKEAGVKRPIVIGGGVDERNVAAALGVADGVVVSTSLRRRDAAAGDLIQWDAAAIERLTTAASRVAQRP